MLHLIQKVRKRGDLGITKLEKLAFLSQMRMKKNGLDGFDYEFIKWDYGPFTQDLYVDKEFLYRAGLTEHLDVLNLTPKAEELLKSAKELFEANEPIVESIDRVTSKYGRKSAGWLERMLYERKFLSPDGHRVKLKDIPKGTCLLTPLSGDEMKVKREFPESWAETLEILCDKNRMETLEAAVQSARTRGSQPYASPS